MREIPNGGHSTPEASSSWKHFLFGWKMELHSVSCIFWFYFYLCVCNRFIHRMVIGNVRFYPEWKVPNMLARKQNPWLFSCHLLPFNKLSTSFKLVVWSPQENSFTWGSYIWSGRALHSFPRSKEIVSSSHSRVHRTSPLPLSCFINLIFTHKPFLKTSASYHLSSGLKDVHHPPSFCHIFQQKLLSVSSWPALPRGAPQYPCTSLSGVSFGTATSGIRCAGLLVLALLHDSILACCLQCYI